MRSQEYPHNTREQVERYLTDALQLVVELEPPDDLRGICLSKAVDLLSSKQIMYEQPPSALSLAQLQPQ